MRFLLFTHYAPICAMGDIAPGERRMGFARPGKSAILGIVGAALGLLRTDPRHRDLEEGLGYAVRTDAPGRPFADYHTTQTPQQRKGAVFRTRRDELSADDLNTILSVREWRADSLYTVALWERPAAAIGLDAVAAALLKPRFTLYAGRKAGPFGLPLSPRLVEADTLVGAFRADHLPEAQRAVIELIFRRIRHRPAPSAVELAFDLDADVVPEPERIEMRRDAIMDRGRFQFRERAEGVCALENA